ncbi:MAG: chromosome partitioning protein ParA, partial [Pseudomonadota bacterium]
MRDVKGGSAATTAAFNAGLAQIAQDSQREEGLRADALAALERLRAERAEIEDARAGEDAAETDAEALRRESADAVVQLDARLSELTREVAEIETRREALARARTEIEERVARLTARADELAVQRARLEAEAIAAVHLTDADAAAAAARAQLESARAETDTAEGARAQAEAARAAAEQDERAAQSALAKIEAEEAALARLLESGSPDLWPPLVDAVAVDVGFEAALGAALGEDLSAPTDEAAPVRWRTLPPLADAPVLPEGVEPLERVVRAPEALARRLSQIGVVADEAAGHALATQLRPGQRLVSRDGGLWRWDGFTAAAGAPTPAAVRLEQRNRLRAVRETVVGARTASDEAHGRADAARADAQAAAESERAARARLQAADAANVEARDALALLRQKTAEQESRLAATLDAARTVEADLADARAVAARTADEIASLPDLDQARARLESLREDLGARRAEERERQAACEALRRAADDRRRRLLDIEREAALWQSRETDAARQIAELSERRASAEDEKARLALRPAEIAEQRQALLGTIETAEARRREAADRLAEAETALGLADKAARAAESQLAEAREERVRAEGLLEQARVAAKGLAERIAERLEAEPDRLAEIAGLKEDEELPDLAETEKKLERLQRERETMGPVNLRAEVEAEELATQIETMTTERGDLVAAIDKLRQGIQELNIEGRERLMKSFEEVNTHFQELFVRLFGGGRAHLELVESDDPLQAGLEIMASPPGKRLQTLSLLSGGEQALTALALLFGVFLTNPAPICVLDEVDAPLDDANVDRFCTLLEEI